MRSIACAEYGQEPSWWGKSFAHRKLSTRPCSRARSRPALSSWKLEKPWRRKYSLGSPSSFGRTHMWCLRYASSMASSIHGTQPMPASMAPKRSLGWRSATPEAQMLTSGSMVGASEWTV